MSVFAEKLNADASLVFDGEVVLSLQTPHQKLELIESATFGKLLRLDGCNMTSEQDEWYYHEALVHPAATAHAAPKRALILGGGDLGSAEELLKHSTIEDIDLVEIDSAVIECAKQAFGRMHANCFDNPRLHIRCADGKTVLAAASSAYDLIVLDLTDPIGPAESLYNPQSFRHLSRALRPGGAAVLHLGSPFFQPERRSASPSFQSSIAVL
jgi:spermidine synthase